MAKNVSKLTIKNKSTFHSLFEVLVITSTIFEESRRARIRGRFQSIDAHAGQEGLELR